MTVGGGTHRYVWHRRLGASLLYRLGIYGTLGGRFSFHPPHAPAARAAATSARARGGDDEQVGSSDEQAGGPT